MGSQQERIRKELATVLAPHYVDLAFNLPPGSGSIWSMMKGDMDATGEMQFDSAEKLLQFLGQYFSHALVAAVTDSLAALAMSFLGTGYTLRRPKQAIAKSILDDIRAEASEKGSPLAEFLGQVSEIDEKPEDTITNGWQVASSRNRGTASLRNGSGGQGGFNASGRGRDSSSAGGGDGRRTGQGLTHFPTLEERIVDVLLPAFDSPQRNTPGRIRTVKNRSEVFVNVVGHRPRLLYDPHHSVAGKVSLYHGTRCSSVEQFQRRGIDPRYTENEFSRDRAFYASNSIRHAYEHPLHYHPSKGVHDRVAVLEFRVEVEVLHGDKPPAGESRPFSCRWFKRPTREWEEFCIGNMKAVREEHDYDIVIGPVCQPRDNGMRMDVVSVTLPLTQVAFCTRRARMWFESCFRQVFREVRGVQAEHSEENATAASDLQSLQHFPTT